MRVEKCPKCLSEISAYVGFCPNCGHRLFRGRDYFYWTGIVVFSIGTLISVVVIFWILYASITFTTEEKGDNFLLGLVIFIPMAVIGLVVSFFALRSTFGMRRKNR